MCTDLSQITDIDMKMIKVYVGLRADLTDVAVSQTKIGLADRLGLSVKTIERAIGTVKEAGGKWAHVRAEDGLWSLCEVEMIRTRTVGNISNLGKENREVGNAGFGVDF